MEILENVILGGGPAGIGAANALGKDAVLFEKSDRFGGLCSSFSINGFRFDHAVHLSFTKDPIVLDYLKNIPLFRHPPVAMNYAEGIWIKYPAQNNLFPLPEEEKKKIIEGFINRPVVSSPKNYEEWLVASYGDYFAKKYPCRYTRKYWCFEARDLSTTWCGKRMYLPSVEEVKYGATHDSTPNVYYAKEMRYPQTGGYEHFFGRIDSKIDGRLCQRVIKIDPSKKLVFFEGGNVVSYKKLFFSLPLNEVWKLFQDLPNNVAAASRGLVATSMANVSVGFKNQAKIPSLWFYIYDENIPFARAYSPSLKSPENAPEGKSSLQLEYYWVGGSCPLSTLTLQNAARSFIVSSGIAQASDVEFVHVSYRPYANVVFLSGMETKRKVVLDYLDSCGIIPIGRFGKWDYLWSDQSFCSGYTAAKQ